MKNLTICSIIITGLLHCLLSPAVATDNKVLTPILSLLLSETKTVETQIAISPTIPDSKLQELTLVGISGEIDNVLNIETSITTPKGIGSLVFLTDQTDNIAGIGISYGDTEAVLVDATSTAAGLVLMASSYWQDQGLTLAKREEEIRSTTAFQELVILIDLKQKDDPLSLLEDSTIIETVLQIVTELDQATVQKSSIARIVKNDYLDLTQTINKITIENESYVPRGIWAMDSNGIHDPSWPFVIDGREGAWTFSPMILDSDPTEVIFRVDGDCKFCAVRFSTTANFFDTFMVATLPAFGGVIAASYETLSGELDSLGEDEKLYRLAQLQGMMSWQAALMLNVAKTIPGMELAGSGVIILGELITDVLKKESVITISQNAFEAGSSTAISSMIKYMYETRQHADSWARWVAGHMPTTTDARATKQLGIALKVVGALLDAPQYYTNVKFILDTANSDVDYCRKVTNGTLEPYDPFTAECGSSRVDLCLDEPSCITAFGYWWLNSTCNNTPETANTDDNLVAHYKFDGNANDSSGNGNNGTSFGGVSYVAGKIDKAASFDGIDDFINTGLKVADFVSTSMSMSTWLYLKSTNDAPAILGLTEHGNKGGIFLRLYTNNNTNLSSYNGSSWDTVYDSTDNPSLFQWYHYAFTYDAVTKDAMIYKNGTRIALGSIDGIYNFDSNIFTIGNANENSYFTGTIDDLRIYNRALTTSEIQQLADGALPLHRTILP